MLRGFCCFFGPSLSESPQQKRQKRPLLSTPAFSFSPVELQAYQEVVSAYESERQLLNKPPLVRLQPKKTIAELRQDFEEKNKLFNQLRTQYHHHSQANPQEYKALQIQYQAAAQSAHAAFNRLREASANLAEEEQSPSFPVLRSF